TLRARQRLDLRARERTSQVRERPTGLEQRGRRLVRVGHEEGPLAQAGEHGVEALAVEGLSSGDGCPLEAVDDPELVALGLQPPEEPRSGVAEAFVVEVDGILGRQDDAEAERARLLE